MTVDGGGDLDPAQVSLALGDRPARTYPALLSTEAVAMAWARDGAASGAVVVADYQASPRGRAGLPWTAHLGRGLGFTLVHRDECLPPDREGWPYVAALLGLHDVVGTADSGLAWPDAVCAADGTPLARLGVHAEPGTGATAWVTVTVLVEEASPPRAPLLGRLVEAVERRLAQQPPAVLDDYRPRCTTLGRRVRARLLPVGPDGPEVTGEAVDVEADGALVLRTARGNRIAVPPDHLGLLEEPQGAVVLPVQLLRGRRPSSREGRT